MENLKLENPNAKFDDGLRVVKTRERSGQLAQETDSKPVVNEEEPSVLLNFDSFGTSNETEKDDLKLISGIGPFIEKKLNNIGIYTYEQISKFSSKDIDDITELIEFFPGRIKRDNWTQQAQDLMK